MQRILFLLFCLCSFCGACQINTHLFIDGQLERQLSFRDTLELKNFVEDQKFNWMAQGYYFAGLDSVVQQDASTHVFLHQGQKLVAAVSGIKRGALAKKISKMLGEYNDGGFPFARIWMDSLDVEDRVLTGSLNINPGPEIRYDSAFFFEPIKTNHDFVYHLLDMVPGEPFRESAYQNIQARVERSPFLSLRRPTDISFSQNLATIFLDLEEQTTNSFQGVLGLQQNQNGRSSVVGSLDFAAQNLFNSGHQLEFAWESFSEASQNLDLFYKHAHLLGGKLSPSVRFGLLRQDTTFLTRVTGLGINTFIGANISLMIEYEGSNGSLISSDVENISERNLADYQRNFYQLALSKGYFSSLSSLSQGMVWRASVGGGTKKVERNTALPNSFYDSIALQTNFLRLEGKMAYQVRLGKRKAIFHDLELGLLENQQLLLNELYRVGGLSTLRGFNEKNFFASQFLLSRFEFRSFFENNSFVYAFYDQLLFKRSNRDEYPFGIGLGFALETSTGQFSFALASGNSRTQSLSFSELRAHFGFITKF